MSSNRPPDWMDPGVMLNGGRPCFCGVWVSGKRFHKFITGHKFIPALDAKFTPADYEAKRL